MILKTMSIFRFVSFVLYNLSYLSLFAQIEDGDSDFEADDDASKVLLISPIHSIPSTR